MSSTIATKLLAGVTVPATPLVDAAVTFAKEHLSELAFNHVMRSFLFGFCIASKEPIFSSLDLEALAVGTILHDQGWDQTGRLVSKDKRFEVDGANAARDFLKREAANWDPHRVQLVWDAIAIHATPSIALHKEPEVAITTSGIFLDFQGPQASGGKLSWEEYDAIAKEFPRLNLAEGVTEILCGLCRDKPQTTYDNFVSDVGERFVERYTREGNRFVVPVVRHGFGGG